MTFSGGTTDERQANPKLCKAIASKLPGWSCDAERKQLVVDQPSLTPDLVFRRGSALVLGEAKWEHRDSSGDAGVESNARARLGISIKGNPNPVEHCLAIRMPEQLSSVSHHDLTDAFLETKELRWALFSEGAEEENPRFPDRGWLEGGVEQLANTIEAVPVSRKAMERAYDILTTGVFRAADVLMGLAPDIRKEIAHELFTAGSEYQTMQMAATIVCNAMLFQQQLQSHIPGIELDDCFNESDRSQPNWQKLVAAWEEILKVNYAPIFRIVVNSMDKTPSEERDQVLKALAKTARELYSFNIDPSHDLVGRVFQWMFVDRQKLATYYTRPESAALLAEFAVSKLSVDWNNLEEVGELVVADFACGTGTLLTAAYQAILSRVRRTGQDPKVLHQPMMEKGLVGLDVLATATHMSTAIMASNFPDQRFENVRIATAPYGRYREGVVYGLDKEKNSVFIGSLEFLALEAGSALFDFVTQQSGTDRADDSQEDKEKDDKQTSDEPDESSDGTDIGDPGSEESEVERKTSQGFEQLTSFELPNYSVDLVIMNPPFSTPTHSQEDHIEPWAALGTTREEQEKMNDKFKRIKGDFKRQFGFVGSGYAGIAANFFDLGFLKLKPAGVLAMVAPLTLVRGNGWADTRELLDKWFDGLTVFSLAPEEQEDKPGEWQAFSADTGMAECLVVGVKRGEPRKDEEKGTVTSISLYQRPESLVESKTLSDTISISPGGGGGGRSLYVGGSKLGERLRGPFYRTIATAGVADFGLVEFLNNLEERGWSTAADSVPFPTARLDDLGEVGPVDRLIGKVPEDGRPRSPGANQAFILHLSDHRKSAQYPVLWWSKTKAKRGFIVQLTSRASRQRIWIWSNKFGEPRRVSTC